MSVSSSNSSLSSKDTLNEEETWRGLKNVPMGPLITDKKKHQPTKFTKSYPEIDRVLNRSRLRSNKKSLIMNGNIAPQCKIISTTYIVMNTCPFDSVIVAMSVAYNDHYQYKIYIDQSKNEFLNFAKMLALHGSTNEIYKRRVELLLLYFERNELYPNVTTINAECNVTKIIESYLKDAPSAIEQMNCNKCSSSITRSSSTIILNIKNKMLNIQELFNTYVEPKYSSCKM